MTDVRVDRLTLSVPGLSEGDAQRLARLVAHGLAVADLPDHVTNAGVLRVRLREGGDVDALAARIVTETLARIARSF